MKPLAERVEEATLFDSIVHGLRSQGWSRFEAEGEALERIERTRRLKAHDRSQSEEA